MEETLPLFEESSGNKVTTIGQTKREGKPRVEEPERGQGEMRFEYPEDALERSHVARVIWDVLGKMDLGPFSRDCESVDGGPYAGYQYVVPQRTNSAIPLSQYRAGQIAPFTQFDAASVYQRARSPRFSGSEMGNGSPPYHSGRRRRYGLYRRIAQLSSPSSKEIVDLRNCSIRSGGIVSCR